MKWKIWPRQYGKTHQLRAWWLENPNNRVILCYNEVTAENSRHELAFLLAARWYENTPADNRDLLENRIMSYRTWLNGTRVIPSSFKGDVAIDDLDAILPQLFHANIVYGAGAGRNDTPVPAHAEDVEKHNAEMRLKFGTDWDR